MKDDEFPSSNFFIQNSTGRFERRKKLQNAIGGRAGQTDRHASKVR